MTCRCGECYDLVITNKAVSDYIHEAANKKMKRRVIIMKLVYVHEDGQQEFVTYFASNHSVSVEQVLEQTNIDMNEWCSERGYEGYDFNALELVESDKIQVTLEYENATQDAIEIRQWIEFLIEENKTNSNTAFSNRLEKLVHQNIVIGKTKQTDDTNTWYELSMKGIDVTITQDFTGDISCFIFD